MQELKKSVEGPTGETLLQSIIAGISRLQEWPPEALEQIRSDLDEIDDIIWAVLD